MAPRVSSGVALYPSMKSSGASFFITSYTASKTSSINRALFSSESTPYSSWRLFDTVEKNVCSISFCAVDISIPAKPARIALFVASLYFCLITSIIS